MGSRWYGYTHQRQQKGYWFWYRMEYRDQQGYHGVTQADIQVGSVAQGKHKAAIAFKNNSVQAAFDGSAGTEDTVASMPYLSYLSLGQSAYSSGKLNGHIRKLRYYPKAISSTELKAMTA